MLFEMLETFSTGSYEYEEALKRQNLRQEDVDLLREKSKRSKIVPRLIHDKQLLLFINACQDTKTKVVDVDKASKWIHLYYKQKRNAPEFFSNRDIFGETLRKAIKNQAYLSLPVTPKNYNVLMNALISHNPRKFIFDDAGKMFIMTAEACSFRNGPRDGAVFIYDMKGTGFRHLFQASLSSIKKGIEFLQVGSPLIVHEIHIFNASYIMDFIFTIIKPFVRKELYERIHLHTGSDYEEFFKKFIPRSHMPSDYGGDLESVLELHEKNTKLLEDMNQYFLLEEDQMMMKYENYLPDADEEDDDFYDAEDE